MEVNSLNSIVSPAAVQVTQGEHRAQTTPELTEAVTAVNSAKLFGQDNELTFAMDRETRRMVVRVVDRKTREVIRQIPSEYLLALAEDLRALSP